MKYLTQLLLLGLLSLSVFSCDEGDDFKFTHEQVKRNYIQREFLMALEANTMTEFVLNPVSLSNILGQDTANLVTKAELLSCSMSIRGIKDKNPDLVLNNFTLQLCDSNRYIFGNCKLTPEDINDFASDQAFNNNILESFTEKILDYYDHGKRNPTLSAVFKPSQEINFPDSVILTFSFEATYHYIKIK